MSKVSGATRSEAEELSGSMRAAPAMVTLVKMGPQTLLLLLDSSSRADFFTPPIFFFCS